MCLPFTCPAPEWLLHLPLCPSEDLFSRAGDNLQSLSTVYHVQENRAQVLAQLYLPPGAQTLLLARHSGIKPLGKPGGSYGVPGSNLGQPRASQVLILLCLLQTLHQVLLGFLCTGSTELPKRIRTATGKIVQ